MNVPQRSVAVLRLAKISVVNQGVEKFKLKLLTYLPLGPKQSDIKKWKGENNNLINRK